ncbi:hypothetical protein CBW18_15450 [Pedobacter sp. AJM]|nr:hypothetical protein CBW18_15450 [Pedobacter sp. AJM]
MPTTQYRAVLITKTVVSKSPNANERSVSKILYTTTPSGDEYFTYLIADGSVSEATSYKFIDTKNGLFFISNRLFSNQGETDSLHIAFDDRKHMVLVGKADQYVLFPANYSTFKQQVNQKHQVLSLLKLLEDNIGNYPIESLLPLMMVSKQDKFGKQVQQAKITTPRSQSDEITDTWTCIYNYNQAGKIVSVKASSGQEVRFDKTVTYNTGGIAIKVHQNIEDRQITDRKMAFNPQQTGVIKWTDRVLETGQNVQTDLVTTLMRRDIQAVKKANLSQAEVLNLVKQMK